MTCNPLVGSRLAALDFGTGFAETGAFRVAEAVHAGMALFDVDRRAQEFLPSRLRPVGCPIEQNGQAAVSSWGSGISRDIGMHVGPMVGHRLGQPKGLPVRPVW